MDAMARGRVERPLEEAGQAPDLLGVEPPLVDHAQRQHTEQRRRRQAQPDQRRPDQEVARQDTGPAEAKRRGQVHVRRGVVHRVGRPEPAHAVVPAMEPVVDEFDEQPEGQPLPPRPRGGRGREHPPRVHGREDQRRQPRGRQRARDGLPERDEERDPAVTPGVALPLFDDQVDRLDDDQHEGDRQPPRDQRRERLGRQHGLTAWRVAGRPSSLRPAPPGTDRGSPRSAASPERRPCSRPARGRGS